MDTDTQSTQREVFLAEMESTVPWAKLHALAKPVASDALGRSVAPRELDRMLRILHLQHWFRLDDESVGEAIRNSFAMRSFVSSTPFTHTESAAAQAPVAGFIDTVGAAGH
ncbi:MAG: hypothetical protein ABI630_05115 [Betaproteobacteria bacterium]